MAATNEGVRAALVTSVQVAVLATLIAVVLGIVTGIALNTLSTQALGGLTFFTLVAGHATFVIVIVVNNASARLRRMSGSV